MPAGVQLPLCTKLEPVERNMSAPELPMMRKMSSLLVAVGQPGWKPRARTLADSVHPNTMHAGRYARIPCLHFRVLVF